MTELPAALAINDASAIWLEEVGAGLLVARRCGDEPQGIWRVDGARLLEVTREAAAPELIAAERRRQLASVLN